jgi:hypothetical protein
MKSILTILVTISLPAWLFSQQDANWMMYSSIGYASENNLGDNGVHISAGVSRKIAGRFLVSATIGSFHMLGVNEAYSERFQILNERSLSFVQGDLQVGYTVLDGSKLKIALNAGPSFRQVRQLWPETQIVIGGEERYAYTLVNEFEAGAVFGLDVRMRLTDRLWLYSDVQSFQYNFFAEYLRGGVGLAVLF